MHPFTIRTKRERFCCAAYGMCNKIDGTNFCFRHRLHHPHWTWICPTYINTGQWQLNINRVANCTTVCFTTTHDDCGRKVWVTMSKTSIQQSQQKKKIQQTQSKQQNNIDNHTTIHFVCYLITINFACNLTISLHQFILNTCIISIIIFFSLFYW